MKETPAQRRARVRMEKQERRLAQPTKSDLRIIQREIASREAERLALAGYTPFAEPGSEVRLSNRTYIVAADGSWRRARA